MSGHSTSHIYQSLFVNLGIAVAKGVAAFMTGSGAMVAETIHSTADCGNQLLLLLGVKRAHQPADATHPLGYGRALYFWSFMVALLLFTGGGVFSIYEGIHKFLEPEPIEKIWIALGVLGFSIALEGFATISNIRAINNKRGSTPFFTYVRQTKDSDFIVVFGENAAASIGLVFAMASLLVAHFTGEPRWDGFGSMMIGLVLVGVAVFLAVEVKSLLVGESADPVIGQAIEDTVKAHPSILSILHVITIQQGPNQVLAAMKVDFVAGLPCEEVAAVINRFEDDLRARRPEVKWIFVEPDVRRK